jgi:hypothetical protein
MIAYKKKFILGAAISKIALSLYFDNDIPRLTAYLFF